LKVRTEIYRDDLLPSSGRSAPASSFIQAAPISGFVQSTPASGFACAALALVLTVFSSCAMPVDINERSDSITAPSLDRTLITPSPDEVVDLTSTITEFSVAAAITNVDPALDQLYYQWFVGYPESTTPQPPVYESQKTILFNACAFNDVLSPPGSAHTIELFISDEPVLFVAGEGRTIPEAYIYVSWTVRQKVACQ
jgi:hypothetical protein